MREALAKSLIALSTLLPLALPGHAREAETALGAETTSISEVVAGMNRLRQDQENRPAPKTAPFCAAMAEPKRGALPDAQVFSALDLGEAKVVILNERHFQSVTLAYADIIAKLRSASPRLNCLYMEYHPGYEPKTREAARR